MPEIDSYQIINAGRIDRMEDKVEELREVLKEPVYADEPWALTDAYAEAMFILHGLKNDIRAVEKHLSALYNDRTRK
jgi:hypothetical protein